MRRAISVMLCAMMVFSGLAIVTDDGKGAPAVDEAPLFSGSGSGTIGDPYVVTTIAQLQEMNLDLGAYYIQGNDVDASATSGWNWNADHYDGFIPVGNITAPFTGSFDGQGFKISGIFINQSSMNDIGLFGYMAGIITNLVLSELNITGNYYVGGLMGENGGMASYSSAAGKVSGNFYVGGLVGAISAGTVSDCHADTIVKGNSLSGGLVGANLNGGTVNDSSSSGNVTGGTTTGGFIGRNNEGLVANCCVTGNVIGTGNSVGGLAGINSVAGIISNSTANGTVTCATNLGGGLVGSNYYIIENSYATGNVIGTNTYFGGLVGRNFADGIISKSYSTGTATGTSYLGGLLGYNNGIAADCFWDIETSGTTASAAGTGKTTAEMMQQATFTNWNFTDVWGIEEGASYPYLLAFQNPAANEYIAHAPIRIHSDADFDAAHGVSAGNGTSSNPWIIEKFEINGTGYGYCLYIANATGYFIVRECYLHHASGRPGVYYWNAGISFTNINHGAITDNTFTANGWAITLMSSNGNTISHNNASNNEYGIYIDNCNSNTVSHNTASSNSNTGIYLQSSPSNIITENTISSNGQNGIRFWSTCNGNTITNNAISFNSVYGFIISDSCYTNTVYHNNFISNANQASNLNSNFWDNGYPSGGNYWSNYAGVDANGDGIGDTPHTFTGGQDNYPLMQPYLMMPMVLISGWNLISFPMEQPSIDGAPIRRASDLANQTSAVMISEWNPLTQTYTNYIPGFHLPTDPQNFAIGPDDALFVHSSGSQDVSVSGYRSSGQRSVSLAPGWNTVGYHSTDLGDVGTDWAPQVSCGIYDDICCWDGTTFVHYIFSTDVMQLVPGRGYFVWSDTASTLIY